jgi:UrcA family protein
MLALASALALGFAAAAPAAAEPYVTYEGASERVRYDDLNLNNNAGATAMLARIERAAGVVCGHSEGIVSLTWSYYVDRCVNAEMAEAVADLGNARVTSLYYGRHPEIIVASR